MTVDLEWLRRWAFDLFPILLDAAAKGLILLALTGGLLLALPKASAATRQLIWLLALAAMLLLPLASATLPAWGILPNQFPFELGNRPPQPLPQPVNAPDHLPPSEPVRMAEHPVMPAPSLPFTHASHASQASPAITPSPVVSSPHQDWWTWGVPVILLTWLAGALACLLPLTLGWLSLWRLGRRSQQMTDGSWLILSQRAAQAINLRRPIRLLQSREESMPMVWGIFQSKLLLPAEAEGWTVQRRWVVLLHELAHAKRRDCLAKLIARIVCSFYWFNPLCWIAFKLMQREAEVACDDLVLNSPAFASSGRQVASTTPETDSDLRNLGEADQPIRPSDYAQHLLEIASGLKSGMLTSYNSIAMARKSKLEGRLLSILDASRNRRGMTRLGILIAAGLVATVTILLACIGSESPQDFTSASIELHMNLESGKYVPSPQPVAILKVTDKKQLVELRTFFPEMDKGRKSPQAGAWEPNASIRFTRSNGGQVLIHVGTDGQYPLAVWSEGEGDWQVKGDLKAFLLVLQKQQAQTQPATQPGTSPVSNPETGDISDSKAAELWGAGAGGQPAMQFGPIAYNLTAARNGSTLATMTGDRADIWDGATGKHIRRFVVNTSGTPRALALSPDGDLLAVGNGKVFDVATGRQIPALELRQQQGESHYHFLKFSTDGRLLVAAVDRKVRIYRTDKWELASVLTSPIAVAGAPIGPVAMSADARYIAIALVQPPGHSPPGAVEQAVTLWDTATGNRLLTLRDYRNAIALSPDGELLAVTSANGEKLEVYSVEKGDVMHRLTGRNLRPAFSADGTVLAVAERGTMTLYRVGSYESIARLVWEYPYLDSLTFTSDGRMLVGSVSAAGLVWKPGAVETLRQEVSTQPATPPAEAHFGPVRTAIIPPLHPSGGYFLNVASGTQHHLGEQFKVGDARIDKWLSEQGADFGGIASRGLLGIELAAVRVPDKLWDTPAAKVLEDATVKSARAQASVNLLFDIYLAMNEPTKQQISALLSGQENVTTYFFRTRDGTCGLLQLLTISQDYSSGIKMRYKLVQQSTQPVRLPASLPATQPAMVKVNGPPWEVRLPNGAVVELVGLAESPSSGKAWWGPDGQPLANRPYVPQSDPFGGRTWTDRKAVEVAYRIKFPKDSQEHGSFFSTGENKGMGSVVPLNSGREPIYSVKAEAVLFRAGQETTDIRIGAAAGAWKPVARGKFATNGTVQDFKPVDAPGFIELMAPPKDAKEGAFFSAVMDLSWDNVAWRFVAHDDLGMAHRLHEGRVRDLREEGKPLRRRYDFIAEPPTKAKLVSLRLDVRPFHYAEFQNVTLLPGKKAALRVVTGTGVRDEAPASEAAVPVDTNWSQEQGGVQMRLSAPKLTWREDEVPMLKWSVRNRGTRQFLQVADGQRLAQLEVDGVWHHWPAYLRGAALPELPPGKSLVDQAVTLGPIWSQTKAEDLEWRRDGFRLIDPEETRSSLILSPGKHTVRLAVVVMPSRVDTGDGFRVISPPLDLVVKGSPAGQAASWPPKLEVLKAAKEAIFSTTIVLQTAARPDEPKLKEWIATALAKTRQSSDVAKGSALQAPAVQLADAMATLQVAFARDANGAAQEFKAAGDAERALIGALSGETQPAEAERGKVVEFTIEYPEGPGGGEAPFNRNRIFYDLDTSQHHQLPAAAATEGGPARQVQDSGVDLYVMRVQGGLYHLWHVGMTYWSVKDDQWDVDASAVRELVQHGKPVPNEDVTGLPGIAQHDRVWAFRTARGNIGVIQFLGQVDGNRPLGPRGYRFRYKLLGQPNTPSAMQPATQPVWDLPTLVARHYLFLRIQKAVIGGSSIGMDATPEQLIDHIKHASAPNDALILALGLKPATEQSIALLTRLLSSSNPFIKLQAARAFALWGRRDSVGILMDFALGKETWENKMWASDRAAEALLALGERLPVPQSAYTDGELLMTVLKAQSDGTDMQDSPAVMRQLYRSVLHDSLVLDAQGWPDKDLRIADTAAGRMRQIDTSTNPRVRRVATLALGLYSNDPAATAKLVELLKDEDPWVALHAARWLALRGQRECVAVLMKRAAGEEAISSSEFERNDAAWALLAMGNQPPRSSRPYPDPLVEKVVQAASRPATQPADARLRELVQEADVIVVATAGGGGPGNREIQKKLLSSLGYKALLPRLSTDTIILVEPLQFLKGDLKGNTSIEFYCLTGLTLRTRDIEKSQLRPETQKGVWILKRHPETKMLWATEREAWQPLSMMSTIKAMLTGEKVPTETAATSRSADIPIAISENSLRQLMYQQCLGGVELLRTKLRKGTLREKSEVLKLFVDFGVIELIPDVIDTVTDLSSMPKDGDTGWGVLAHQACTALVVMSVRLDGTDRASNPDYTLDFGSKLALATQTKNIQINWRNWWQKYLHTEAASLRNSASATQPTGMKLLAITLDLQRATGLGVNMDHVATALHATGLRDTVPVEKVNSLGSILIKRSDGRSVRLDQVCRIIEFDGPSSSSTNGFVPVGVSGETTIILQIVSKLEFRVVPNAIGSSRLPVLPLFIGEGTPKKYVPEALKELAEHGPDLARQRKDEFQWFELVGNVTFPDAVIGEHKGRKYLLLANRPPYVMVPGEGKDAWGLTKVYATKDNQNRRVVGFFELDDRGAERFTALTKANLNNALAILIDGKVVSAPTIMSALGKTGIITGRFTEQEVDALVKALRAGMPAQTKSTAIEEPLKHYRHILSVQQALEALKADVVKLTKDYPQLAGAKDAAVTDKGWSFTRDYREMGKGRYEDTGPFPVGIGLRIMPVAEFKQKVLEQQMPAPSYRWDGLELVGWVDLHRGDGIPGKLVGALQQALHDALGKIGASNRQAFDARLPDDIKRQRAELLAKADADIRNGVQKLTEQFPYLKQGQPWDQLSRLSEPGRIGIYLRRHHGGKGGTDAQEIPEGEKYGILVVIKPPPDEHEQMELFPMYPALGLFGQVNANASNPKLDAALKKLVSDAMALLGELEKKAAAPPASQPDDVPEPAAQ